MTRDQILAELRKELGFNERLAKLLNQFAKIEADSALRRAYRTNDYADLLSARSAGLAIETFTKSLTETPSAPGRRPGA